MRENYFYEYEFDLKLTYSIRIISKKQLNIKGPVSLHFPYTFVENREQLSHKEILQKTHDFMKNQGILKLKEMLALNN